MSLTRQVRPILALAAATVAACAGHHTYGVSLGPASQSTLDAEQYLTAEGYTTAPHQTGEVMSMEHRHGDSVDVVRIVAGGRYSSMTGFTMPGGGGAAYVAGGVAQTGNGGGYLNGVSGGSSSGIVLEVTSYRVDQKGARHAIEPSEMALAQADSVITLVTRIPSSMRQ